MATQLVHLRGIPENEAKDRGKNVREKSFINSSAYTEGELEIRLLLERALMLADYYPEVGFYKQQVDMLENALVGGLHYNKPYYGALDNRLQATAKAIKKASKKAIPAMSVLQLTGRQNLAKGIGDPYITELDCNELYPFPGFGADTSAVDNWNDNIQKCEDQNAYRKVMNDNWEQTSYHPLYEFVVNPNSKPQTVAVKTVLHKLAISNVNEVTKISTSNIRQWTRNGVMRNNIKTANVGPLSPEETIEAIKRSGQEGIGLEIGTIIAIVTAVATLLTSASGFVNALKAKRAEDAAKFTNQLQGWGTANWGPLGEDWIIDQDGNVIPNPDSPNNSNNNMQDILPIVLLGAGAALLLN